VAKWSESWLENIQTKVRPSAYETDVAATRAIVAAIGSVKLSDLTPADVRAVAAYLRRNGKSSSTALRYHGSLMRMLKAASLDGDAIPPNVLLAEKPKKAVNDRDAVPPEQAIKALAHIATLPDGSRWALAFLQGLRQAEALGLTWSQVDLDAGTLTVSWQAKSLRYVDRSDPTAGFEMPDGYEARRLVGSSHLVRPKSAAGWRVQPLIPWAVNSLRAWREVAPDNAGDLVWPGRTIKGETWPRNPASDRAQWEAIQKAVSIAHPSGRPWTGHEIRHGTATLLLALGVPESVRIAIMGHSTIASTRGYEHVDLTLAREALDKVGERLGLGG
jgi:integrase